MNLEKSLSKLIERDLTNMAHRVLSGVGDVVRMSDQEFIVTYGGKQLSVTVQEEFLP